MPLEALSQSYRMQEPCEAAAAPELPIHLLEAVFSLLDARDLLACAGYVSSAFIAVAAVPALALPPALAPATVA